MTFQEMQAKQRNQRAHSLFKLVCRVLDIDGGPYGYHGKELKRYAKQYREPILAERERVKRNRRGSKKGKL